MEEIEFDDSQKPAFNTNTLKQAVKEYLINKDEAVGKYGEIGTWNTSGVKGMAFLFWFAKDFNENINEWDTSNVTTMHQMFTGAAKFNQHLDKWDISKVQDMTSMFSGATSFNQDLVNREVSNDKRMMTMFFGADAFKQPNTVISWERKLEKPGEFGSGKKFIDENNVFTKTNLTWPAKDIDSNVWS